MSFKSDVFADLVVVAGRDRNTSWAKAFLYSFRNRSFRAVLMYRIGHLLGKKGHRISSWLVGRLLCGLTSLTIEMTAELGPGVTLPHLRSIIIGGAVKIGPRATILQGTTIGGRGWRMKPDGQHQPIIGADVLIGAGARILGPVTIGDRVKIGANAVVLKDLPDDAVAVGVPARIVRIGDRRIGLLAGDDELAGVLRDFRDRLEALESRQE